MFTEKSLEMDVWLWNIARLKIKAIFVGDESFQVYFSYLM